MKNTPASNIRRMRNMRNKRRAGLTERGCAIEGCPFGHYARGYCERHYDKRRRIKR